MKNSPTILKLSVALVPLALISCAPQFDDHERRGAEGADTALTVTLEPEAPLDGAPRVLRIHLRPKDGHEALDPAKLVLVSGDVSESQLGQLARGQPSKALEERFVPILSWTEPSAGVVVAPTEALEPAGVYTLASGEPRVALPLTIAESADPLGTLSWPPEGQATGRRTAVWCGQAALPDVNEATALSPRGDTGSLSRGAIGAIGRHCLRFDPSESSALDIPELAPPAVDLGDGRLLLEPIGLRADGPAPALTALACEPLETAIGPGCAAVADDRMTLRTPAEPLLWAFALPSGDRVMSSAGEPLLIAPLPPSTQLPLPLGVMTRDGVSQMATPTIATAEPMAHVVINEVLANPIGEEPDQEWVELYNDGARAAFLADYRLIDIGGEVVLPALYLPPGGYALVVNDSFDADSPYDPRPDEHAIVLRVPSLGKNGLNNQGEPLELVRGPSQIVSRFPPEPKPKAGHSVVRLHPAALDELPTSFARSELPTPGAANVIAAPD